VGYSIRNLKDVEDAAVKFGFSETQEARFATDELDAEQTGVSYHVVRPGQRQGFGHRHREAEEIYVVLRGSGRVKLDDELIEIGPLDAIRLGPEVARSLEAGPDGLEILAFGPRRPGDHEMVDGFWQD
jgi:mannose-6-phosphate isomerase-like protein (cupin superfamily)